MVMGMPLGRYFIFTGSLLLALLFLTDWYLPPLAVTPARGEVDRTIIRLRSAHKWPERIVIDTSLPTIVPPPATVAEALPGKAPPVSRPPREAFAQVTAQVTPMQAATPAIATKSALKRRTRTARTSRHIANYEASGFHNSLPMSW
jgi:hypothetical protein